jgi:hypothetical protein
MTGTEGSLRILGLIAKEDFDHVEESPVQLRRSRRKDAPLNLVQP